VQQVAFDTTSEKRRHAVEVRREDDVRFASGGDDVEPSAFARATVDKAVVERLLEHRIASLPEIRGQDAANFCFASGR
jgi:hypothetical protein